MRDCVIWGSEIPVFSLRGNNDFGVDAPVELCVMWEDVRLFACHGHTYGVKSGLTRLAETAGKRGAQVALFGHTHRPCLRQEGALLLCNPGSIGLSYGCPASYGELLLQAGKAAFRLVEI